VTDGLATSDFASIGTCAGKVVMILFDSSLWTAIIETLH
jgi:hypothetical protein